MTSSWWRQDNILEKQRHKMWQHFNCDNKKNDVISSIKAGQILHIDLFYKVKSNV